MKKEEGCKVNWKAFGIFLILAAIAGAAIGYGVRLFNLPMESRGYVIGILIAVTIVPLYVFYFNKKVLVFCSRKKKR